MIDALFDPVFWTQVVDTMVKPVIFSASDFAFNIFLLFATFFSIFFYFIAMEGMFPEKRALQKFKDLIKWPMVSVQIPTCNEAVALRCAEKCLDFDYPKDRFEVIIGDDSKDANVSRLIDEFAEKHKGRVKVTRRGENIGYKAGNLNNMLKFSRGEIVAIFDSDFVPPGNFLKEIVKPFSADRKTGTVQARWDFLNIKQSFVSRLASATLIVYHHLIMPIFSRNGISLICGSAEAVRKDLLVKLGGWQSGSLTEDTEFSLRVLKAGYKNIYLKDLSVKGEVPYNFKSFKKQQMRWAYGNTRAYMQHCKDILFSGLFSFKQKMLLTLIVFGYITAPLLAMLFITGVVSFITNTPAPIDLPRFFSSLGENIFLTSGFVFAALMGLSRYEKMTASNIFFVILSSLTIGVLISFFTAKGFVKALLKRPMQWYIIQKKGNEEVMKASGISAT